MDNYFIEKENIVINEFPVNNQGKLLNESLRTNLRNKMDTLYNNNNQAINMKELQELLTPIIKECDLFISYSYSDKEIVEKVVKYYRCKGYRVFADCMFWEDVNAEITNYNRKFNKLSDHSFGYPKCNKIALSFYTILMDSLYDMIRFTDKFLFIKSHNSSYNDMTLSPWIYLENKFANTVCKNQFLNEELRHFTDSKLIVYSLDLTSFRPLKKLDEIEKV